MLFWVGFSCSRLQPDLAQHVGEKVHGIMRSMVSGVQASELGQERMKVRPSVLSDFCGRKRSLCPVLCAKKAGGDMVLWPCNYLH